MAVTDFNERDFYYMKRLHSAGAISQEQLGMILKKVWEIYLMKGCSDEMQMSLSDFEFAVKLPRKKNKLEYESDLEQVVKTALLWIEEDLSFRHGGSPVEINSQTLFPMAMCRKRRVMPLSVKIQAVHGSRERG